MSKLKDNNIEKKEESTLSISDMYKRSVDIGTETMSPEDMNTPVLKIIQPNTQNIDNKKDGFYYRGDQRVQLEYVPVNLVSVASNEVENYNKDGFEKIKIYYGFYAGTAEPFKMFVRGWGLSAHRDFQTEVNAIKKGYGLPMLALTIILKTEKVNGTMQDSGKPYTTYKPVFSIEKDENGVPIAEEDPDRMRFLIEAARRFAILQDQTENDKKQSDAGIKINPEEIPF